MPDTAAAPGTEAFLDATIARTRARFVAEKSLLSFAEYLDVVRAAPAQQARDAATYLRDCFLHYGTEKLDRPYGRVTRFKLFDCPFDGGRDPLIGHETVQEQVFGLVQDFVREGRVNKLILLHGPNGSAKSSFIACILRALEHYSREPEGALYSFNWVFPTRKLERTSIGFGTQSGVQNLDTFARLGDAEVDARIRSELRDHPLLLLPRDARIEWLRGLLGPDAALPDALTEGDLSPRSRAIFDALLKASGGDLGEVLRHVQVERFHVSRRYRAAAVTVDPQMRVDAGARQITADRSASALPPSLQNLNLYEAVGDLVDANRGVLEFNDLLKRPLEAFKYILSTCEKGTASLDMMTLFLDTVFIGSSNANHLDAFTEMGDFASFKARIELVRVPYLTDYTQEALIYRPQLAPEVIRRAVAPHTDTVAALWAVLTRLRRPEAELAPPALRKTLARLTPLQKAELYARGKVPAGLSRDAINELRAYVPTLHRESDPARPYEGRIGASPREIKAALLGAARRDGHHCLSPVALLDELLDLCKQTQIYDWLRAEPDGDYQKPEAFVGAVREWYFALVEEELHQAMGLIDADRTADLFKRYVDHVTHWVKKEKRLNPLTGRYEDPDEGLMRDVEKRLGQEGSAQDVRGGVLHRIAAWRMDHPEAVFDLVEIFGEQHDRLTDSFYEEKRQAADRIKRNLLAALVDDGAHLADDDRAVVDQTLARLAADFGYAPLVARDVVGALLKQRHRAG
ncbi:serine protein kinase PrkA [Myxococcota bacterium]|nr:serine protein kinase PrkA [Myxococcota bacterium]